MFTNVRQKLPIPQYHTRNNVTTYLSDVVHLMNSMHKDLNFLDEICLYLKTTRIEFKAQYHLLNNIYAKKSFPIKAIYNKLLEHKLIENNIQFNPMQNSYHDIMAIFELLTLSKFSKENNVAIYFYQNGEVRDVFTKLHTRQKDADGYFVIYNSEKRILKGIDVKLGTLKDSPSRLYPIFIKENKNEEILNSLNLEEYLDKKLQVLKNFVSTTKNPILTTEFNNLRICLINTNILIKKFKALNDFDSYILLHIPNKFYNAAYIQSFEHSQPVVYIEEEQKESFINSLYEDPVNNQNLSNPLGKLYKRNREQTS